MTGWISLHRKIKDHWIWENSNYLKWWIDILLRANHKDVTGLFNNKPKTYKRGTFHTSTVQLAEQWKVSRNTVNRFLRLLEEDSMIELKKSNNGTTVKVLNYNVYQGFSEEKRQRNEQRTEQQTAQQTEQRTEQRTEQQKDSGLNTNNNDNNELIMNNNDNKENKRRSFSAVSSDSDYSEIIEEYNKLAFGLPTERTYEQIEHWLKDHSKELIIKAMRQAHDAGKHNISYVNGILRNLKQKGIKTVEEFEVDNTRFNATKNNNSNYTQYYYSEEAQQAKRQAEEKIKRDSQNIKTVLDSYENLPF